MQYILSRKSRPSDATGRIYTPHGIVRLDRGGPKTIARCDSRHIVKILTTRHGFTLDQEIADAADTATEGAPGEAAGDGAEASSARGGQEAPSAPAGQEADASGGGEPDPGSLTVGDLTVELEAGLHDAALPELLAAEKAGKARKTAIAAIEARIAEWSD